MAPLPTLPLPNDIITEILTKLPAKALLRSKSFAKSWNSLISDPQFSKLRQNRHPRLLFFAGRPFDFTSLDPEAALAIQGHDQAKDDIDDIINVVTHGHLCPPWNITNEHRRVRKFDSITGCFIGWFVSMNILKGILLDAALLHWVTPSDRSGSFSHTTRREIVVFYLINETFRALPQPDELDSDPWKMLTVGVLGEQLCLIGSDWRGLRTKPNGNLDGFGVWIMKE